MSVLAPPAPSLDAGLEQPPDQGRSAATKVWRVAPLCLGMVTLPLISPAAPGNISVADVGIAATTGSVLLTAAYRNVPLRLPYAVGAGLLLITGTFAGLVAQASLFTTGVTLIQDVWMLLFGAALANACREPAVLSAVLRFWVGSATVYAGLVMVGLIAHINVLAGLTSSEGYRAQFTLGDPNVSGNYFLIAFFVLRAMQWPAQRRRRWPMLLLLLLAVGFSGSNGALLGLVAGTAIGFLLRLRREHGMVSVIAASSLTCLVVLLAAPHINTTALREKAADSVPVLRDGLGRSNQSTSDRKDLWSESTQLWLHGNMLGIGPAETKATFTQQNAAYVKEAHNDYFAALNERGFLGAIGLIVLISTIALRITRPTLEGLRPDFAAVVRRPELLVSAGVTMALAAMFYETLHFRHFWALLGVAAALDLWGRKK